MVLLEKHVHLQKDAGAMEEQRLAGCVQGREIRHVHAATASDRRLKDAKNNITHLRSAAIS